MFFHGSLRSNTKGTRLKPSHTQRASEAVASKRYVTLRVHASCAVYRGREDASNPFRTPTYRPKQCLLLGLSTVYEQREGPNVRAGESCTQPVLALQLIHQSVSSPIHAVASGRRCDHHPVSSFPPPDVSIRGYDIFLASCCYFAFPLKMI